MTKLLSEYDTKVAEIDVYFAFLEDVLQRGARLRFPRGRKRKEDAVGDGLQKILKANAYLLLYNLMESSVRSGVAAIYEAIQQESLSYSAVREQFRRIWVHQQFIPDEARQPTKNELRLVALIDRVLAGEPVRLNARDLNIAGNVDADQVRKLEQRFGFVARIPPGLKGGAELRTVKTQRNNLAHGHMSFMECGRDLTYASLQATRRQVIPYLRRLLVAIEKFVDQRQFAI